jgi:hypothetical protein
VEIQKIQYELAKIDIWLRGGLSVGDVKFNEQCNQIVGQGFIDAYLLEENLAIHPRVILDNRLIEYLEFNSAEQMINSINNDVPKGTEGYSINRVVLFEWTKNKEHAHRTPLQQDVALFIDYLAYAFESDSDLYSIITNIQHNLYRDNTTYSKFRWLTNYLLSSFYPPFSARAGYKIDDMEGIAEQVKRL